MFTGTYTAIVTPFRKNGEIDEAALERLIKAQVKGKVDGVVPVGTTGESPSLDYDEHKRVVELTVRAANGKIKVLAGTGANSTHEAIELTKSAEAAGADGSLQVCPYYNKPTQEGLYQHFRAIARNTRLPIVLYSVPSRSVIQIDVATVKRLAKDCPNIVGIKEAGGDADRVSQLRHGLGENFTILSGDDAQTLPFMVLGAEGVISVASNIIPGEISKLVKAAAAGKYAAAQKLHYKYYQLFKDLFIETSPGPVKAAMAILGQIEEVYRLPMTKIDKHNRAQLRKTLKQCGILA
ncbi:MAG: 4-hydroxy-tetrahydrodipicolinate synthase [Candidatus Binatia bacterium]|jgi:4-hydroxy-tetrahydrodipicolinate synthase